jgi:hypothetical protein
VRNEMPHTCDLLSTRVRVFTSRCPLVRLKLRGTPPPTHPVTHYRYIETPPTCV